MKSRIAAGAIWRWGKESKLGRREMMFPSKKKDLLIEVFYLGVGTPPFICGIEGHATTSILQEIEDMFIMETDPKEYSTFGKGEGSYLFKAVHEPADEGMAAYWDMEQIAFSPLGNG